LLDDVVGLERFAVVLQDQIVHAEVSLGSQMSGELPRVIALDTDRALAIAQNLADFPESCGARAVW